VAIRHDTLSEKDELRFDEMDRHTPRTMGKTKMGCGYPPQPILISHPKTGHAFLPCREFTPAMTEKRCFSFIF